MIFKKKLVSSSWIILKFAKYLNSEGYLDKHLRPNNIKIEEDIIKFFGYNY